MAKGRKTGGRVKGTPNKSTNEGKKIALDFLSRYSDSGQMEQDFLSIEDPVVRLSMAEKFLNYVMPKKQATAVDLTVEDNAGSLEDRLRDLSSPTEGA